VFGFLDPAWPVRAICVQTARDKFEFARIPRGLAPSPSTLMISSFLSSTGGVGRRE